MTPHRRFFSLAALMLGGLLLGSCGDEWNLFTTAAGGPDLMTVMALTSLQMWALRNRAKWRAEDGPNARARRKARARSARSGR